jgi:hypothetical protein
VSQHKIPDDQFPFPLVQTKIYEQKQEAVGQGDMSQGTDICSAFSVEFSYRIDAVYFIKLNNTLKEKVGYRVDFTVLNKSRSEEIVATHSTRTQGPGELAILRQSGTHHILASSLQQDQ